MNDLSHQSAAVATKFQDFLRQSNEEADRAMRPFVFVFFTFGLLIAPFYSTWAFALGIGGSCLLAYLVCAYFLSGTFASRLVISLIFATYMLQFIGQMHGMYEMHFFFFINIAILIIYQDWRIMAPYTVFAIGHHSVFFAIQMSGYDVKEYFINIENITYVVLAFHFGLAALMAVVCGWWAIILRKRTRQDFENKLQLEEQLTNVSKNVAFAQQISQGALEANYELSDGDGLGESLLEMRTSLLEAKAKDQREKFKNTGLAELSAILRNSASDVEELSQQVIRHVINYLQINQGGIFILRSDEGSPYLSLTACYAFERKKYLERRLAVGEGLVGQAVLEKDTIYLAEVPTDYVNITSGLGKATPRSILIVPLKTSDEVVGVIELAAFRPFEPFEIEFLEKIAESIAASVKAVQISQQTKELLAQARINEEELRSQEEEMRQNMEELQATQEEADRKVKAYEDLLRQKEEEIAQVKEQA
jgi:methyl-accepting chemotaxis protein